MGKRQISDLEIIDLDSEGRGVGRTNGKVIFVDSVVPGDVVDATIYKRKKGFGIALVTLLLVRIKWIALLTSRVKKQSIALLIVVNLVNLVLFENYMNSAGSNPFNLVLSSQVFLFFMAGFVFIYSMHS